MKLKTHGRYEYLAITERTDYSRPGAKRRALHFCLNVEHLPFGEGLRNDCAAPHPPPNISQTPVSVDLLRAASFRYMMDWPRDDSFALSRVCSSQALISEEYKHEHASPLCLS